MKKLIACVLVFASLSAKAATELETQALTAVIANASTIVLIDPATEQPYPQEEQLPALLAQALLQNFSQMGEFGGDLGNVNIECNEADYGNAENATSYNCMVYIGVGTFRKDNETLSGPESEGSIGFQIAIDRPWNPAKKIKIVTTEALVEIGE